MSTPPVTPEPIIQVCTGLWAAGVLKGAVELHVFDQLTTEPRDAAGLGQALQVPSEGLQILLDALVALEFLAHTPEGYTLTPVSAEFLVSSKPTYLGTFAAEILGDSTLYDLYSQYRRVVSDGYHRDPWEYRRGSNALVERLVHQLFILGYPVGQAIADHQEWTAGNPTALRMLDVGCGSAVYGLVALSRLPQARLTAQDWPHILPAAQEFAVQMGVAERVATLAGDFRTLDFGGPYDVVFLGHILHNYDDATNRDLVRKCVGVLAPGGRVVVVDFLAEAGEAASAFSWLFSTMMYAAQGTRSWSSAEIVQLLQDCGASRTAVGGDLPTGFVIGYRD